MTANIEFVIGERKDVLRVPNAALHFTPAGVSSEDTETARKNIGGGTEAGRKRAQSRIQNLAIQLALTPEQQQAVVTIFRETGAGIRGLQKAGMHADQRVESIRQIRAQRNTRIKSLLNINQRKKFELILTEAELNAGRRTRVWTLDSDGKPFAINIVSGISDGINSEILRGQIEEGTMVVVDVSRTDR